MDANVYWLITLYCAVDETLVKLAVRFDGGILTPDQEEHYLEPENREAIMLLLPKYLRDIGALVDASPLFDVIHVQK